MKNLIGYCGLNCEKCEARIATLTNDNEKKIEIAKSWSISYGIEITQDMVDCEGCRANGAKSLFCDNLCPIRQCATKSKVKTCGDCNKVNVCGKVSKILETNRLARKNILK